MDELLFLNQEDRLDGQRMIPLVSRIFIEEGGQDLTEYGLLVGFIALVVIAGAALFGTNLLAFWNSLVAALPW
jgi:pilus assembly protein Flp/PilA